MSSCRGVTVRGTINTSSSLLVFLTVSQGRGISKGELHAELESEAAVAAAAAADGTLVSAPTTKFIRALPFSPVATGGLSLHEVMPSQR